MTGKTVLIVMAVCVVLFFVAAIIDQFLLAFVATLVFLGTPVYYFINKGKANAKAEMVERRRAELAEQEAKRIASIPRYINKYINAVGMRYHREDVDAFHKELIKSGYAEKNVDYGMTKKQIDDSYIDDKIYEYEDVDCQIVLEPEPTNEHDPNAVKVMVAVPNSTKWYHIGYVPREDTGIAKELIEKGEKLVGKYSGAKYKALVESSSGDMVLARDSGWQFKAYYLRENPEWLKYHPDEA